MSVAARHCMVICSVYGEAVGAIGSYLKLVDVVLLRIGGVGPWVVCQEVRHEFVIFFVLYLQVLIARVVVGLDLGDCILSAGGLARSCPHDCLHSALRSFVGCREPATHNLCKVRLTFRTYQAMLIPVPFVFTRVAVDHIPLLPPGSVHGVVDEAQPGICDQGPAGEGWCGVCNRS